MNSEDDEYEFENKDDREDSPIPLAKLGGSANTSM